MFKTGKSLKTDSRFMIARGREECGATANEHVISFCGENLQELDGGDGCTAFRIY